MTTKNKIFATVINCMDGRVQLPVNRWIKKKFSIDFVDTITEPGPNKIISSQKNQNLITSIKRRLEISTKYHKSKLVAVIGHHDCAGNPTTDENQKEQILLSVKIIKSWYPQIKVIGLWVNKNWRVERLI